MFKLFSWLKNINFRKEPERAGLVYFGDLTINEANSACFDTLTEVTGDLLIVYPATPNLKCLTRIGGVTGHTRFPRIREVGGDIYISAVTALKPSILQNER